MVKDIRIKEEYITLGQLLKIEDLISFKQIKNSN